MRLAALALALLGLFELRADAAMLLSAAPAAGGPVNNTPPNLSPTGTAAVGATLTCNAGAWTPTPTSSTYQFFRGGSTSVQGPASGNTYVTVSADGGSSITCVQIATAGGTTTSPASNAIAVAGGPLSIAFVGPAIDLGSVTATSLTTAFTVANNSVNEMLVVVLCGDNSTGVDDITSVTYAGTALTLAGKYAAPNALRYLYIYYLMHPAAGSNNVVVSAGSSHALRAIAAEYSGVAASSPVDGSPVTNSINPGTVNTPTTMTTAITTAANDWVLLGWEDSGQVVAGTNTVARKAVSPSFNPTLLDSGGPAPGGSFSMSTAPISTCSNTCQQSALLVAIKPGP